MKSVYITVLKEYPIGKSYLRAFQQKFERLKNYDIIKKTPEVLCSPSRDFSGLSTIQINCEDIDYPVIIGFYAGFDVARLNRALIFDVDSSCQNDK